MDSQAQPNKEVNKNSENQENKEKLRQELKEFGFEESLIEKALCFTSNQEEALNLILTFQEEPNFQVPQNQKNQNEFLPQGMDQQTLAQLGNVNPNQLLNLGQNFQFGLKRPDREYKMVFLVRMDLKMGVGKIAAQVGHSVLGAYKQIVSKIEKNNDKDLKEVLETYENYGQPKIVLKCETKEEFLDLEQKARNKGLNTYMVADAGRTQIEPGSLTVCAIGPGPVDAIDEVTKHLKLL
ncbi:UBA-like protein [Pseudocohnilembus persalinus]|uniref:peptidyl-tRNA hydrolase n=1 Tax=Pseudocohnilembus persalinus TaxID=266149 RepID=A0A0V0R7K2_PSEPJ|nr:UBA-like protein [Pseudocohnilembus persalinus]|eukprot:KRX10466.1 UBA-like protein [Pseudocohnilembus persalinus]